MRTPIPTSPRISLRLVLLVAVTSLLGGCITFSTSGPSPAQVDERAIALYGRGMALYAQHRFGEALATFQEARSLRDGAMLEVQVARTLDRMGQRAKACAVWQKLRRADIAALVEQKIAGARVAKVEIAKHGPRCLGSGKGLGMPELGPTDAPVTIVVVSDFQCPFCARVQPTLRRILATWPGKVRFQFLHQPLSFHKRAFPAARAAVAAQLQGKFWEMHDGLFADHRDLGDSRIEELAASLGLDLSAFKEAWKTSKPVGDFVTRNAAIAAALGARGTPAFFINGRKLTGAQPFARFAKEVERAIGEASAAREGGTEATAIYEVLSEKNNPLYARLVIRGEAPPKPAPNVPKVDETVWHVPVSAHDARMGPDTAPVTLVAFTDFQCPYCARAAGTLRQVREKYGDDVRIVVKHHPLPFHRQAAGAARAAMAAQGQGKFWEMHDALFENARQLSDEKYLELADQLGLDRRRFALDLKKHRVALDARLKVDRLAAASVEARGTPTFFINGRKLQGAQPLAPFVALIDVELKKARQQLSEGTAAADLYPAIIKGGRVFEPFKPEVHAFTTKGRPVVGPKKAPVTVVVFSDYQCPFCGRLDPQLSELVGRMGGRVKLVHKQFPLAFHKQARNAALAALAARKQGRFAAMHRALWANARSLTENGYGALARGAGLKVKRFARDMRSPALTAMLEQDIAEGTAAGTRGTPTLFVNGRRYTGADRSPAKLQALIETHFLGKAP